MHQAWIMGEPKFEAGADVERFSATQGLVVNEIDPALHRSHLSLWLKFPEIIELAASGNRQVGTAEEP